MRNAAGNSPHAGISPVIAALEIVCHACGSLWHAYGNVWKNCCVNCGSRDVHEHTVPTDDGYDKFGVDSQGFDRTGRDTKGDF